MLLVATTLCAVLQGAPLTHSSNPSAPVSASIVDLGGKATPQLLREARLQLSLAVIAPTFGAVVVDLDLDGDEDLVATFGTNEIGVWLNDGRGRLSRATPTSDWSEWAPRPPTPTVDAESSEQSVTVPDDAPTVHADLGRAGPLLLQPLLAATVVRVAATSANQLRQSSPRAPPLD